MLEFSAVHVILKKSEEKGYISNWKLLNRENFSSLRQIGHLAIIFERLQKYRKNFWFFLKCVLYWTFSEG